MAKFTRDFILDKEVLFLGASKRCKMFSEMIFQAFPKHGIKVFPMNDETCDFKVKIYKNFNELPGILKTVYTILDKEDNAKILDSLREKGAKRILFHSKRIVDDEILKECEKLGLETAIACPLMIYSSGLHRIHGFFAGIK